MVSEYVSEYERNPPLVDTLVEEVCSRCIKKI